MTIEYVKIPTAQAVRDEIKTAQKVSARLPEGPVKAVILNNIQLYAAAWLDVFRRYADNAGTVELPLLNAAHYLAGMLHGSLAVACVSLTTDEPVN